MTIHQIAVTLMPKFIQTIRKKLGETVNVGMIAGACLECDGALKPMRVRGFGLPRHTL